jgi:glycosyltransferase involved in cell wall biosynthesis
MLDAYLPYFVEKYGKKVELIVVVNGSTDNTELIVSKVQEGNPQLKMIVDRNPIGKGGALDLGFAMAKGRLIGFADADGATPPAAFQALVDNIGDAGCIIASRWMKDSIVSPPQPLKRRITSRCFNLMVRALFGFKIKDTQCGAKLLTRDAMDAVLPQLGITKWGFDVDMLFHVRDCGFTIKEIPTEWHDVAGSRVNLSSTSLNMALEMIRLRLEYSPFKFIVRKSSDAE